MREFERRNEQLKASNVIGARKRMLRPASVAGTRINQILQRIPRQRPRIRGAARARGAVA